MMAPEKVQHYQIVTEAVNKIKKRHRQIGVALHTNLFLNKALFTDWIEKGKLSIASANDYVVLIHSTEFVDDIFYITSNIDVMLKDIRHSYSDNKRVAIIQEIKDFGRNQESDLKEKNRVLLRFCHTGNVTFKGKSDEVMYAEQYDVDAIKDILNTQFDPITDRLPSVDELRTLIEHKGIILRKSVDAIIIGFIIFELSKQSIHLRYWWTHPHFRGKGVGSSLINKYFDIGKDTIKQYLWVDETNENAIKRYNHFGFFPDGVRDNIYIITN